MSVAERRPQGEPVRHITEEEIDPKEILESVKSERAGAVAIFLGTVRNFSEVGRVEGIRYESYVKMAEQRLWEIEEELYRRWPVEKVRIVHRVGELAVGDISVAVAVSSPHRAEAFEACRHAIERIKREVPIWKEERLVGGGKRWVEGTPITG
jgi:molybdopterin synthase catalytic subunit